MVFSSLCPIVFPFQTKMRKRNELIKKVVCLGVLFSDSNFDHCREAPRRIEIPRKGSVSVCLCVRQDSFFFLFFFQAFIYLTLYFLYVYIQKGIHLTFLSI